ncbi:MAG: hypothetical protein CR981_04610 [Proteobacteria bacterium]|nr:MAG: hypothetical protein CR981_04610 [Pseudomonadota bacterium]
MKQTKAYERLLRARTSLVLKHPFFASLALRLHLREDSDCHTAWTDGRVFCYNPDYINILSEEKLEGLTAHIVMHPACGHHLRREDREPVMWNRACDYAINWLLLDAGFDLPDGYLYLEEYREVNAEKIYLKLIEELDDEQDGEKDTTDDGEEGERDRQDDDEERSELQEQEGAVTEAAAAAGSDPGMAGEVRDLQHSGKDDISETDWDEALIQAAHNAREMGLLPAGLERLVENTVNPKICWETLLARFIERCARSDYTWMMPNRRYLHQDLYLPSLYNHELDHIVLAIDTSGSIDNRELNQFAAEISAVMAQYPARLYVIYCDADIQGVHILERSDLPITLEPKGGGGTDYRPVFHWVEQERISPACLIYLTDMECLQFPAAEPGYPVLWVTTGNNDQLPPFGEMLKLAL